MDVVTRERILEVIAKHWQVSMIGERAHIFDERFGAIDVETAIVETLVNMGRAIDPWTAEDVVLAVDMAIDLRANELDDAGRPLEGTDLN